MHREKKADVLLINKQYKRLENFDWYQDASQRAGIHVCKRDFGIGDSLETNKGFVWVKMVGVRVFSCYYRSHMKRTTHNPFAVFVSEVSALDESLNGILR